MDFTGNFITNFSFKTQAISLIQVISLFLLILPVPSRVTHARNLVWRDLNTGVPPLLYLIMLHMKAKKVSILIREDETVSRSRRDVSNVASPTRDNNNISMSLSDFTNVSRFNIEDVPSIQDNTFANEDDKSTSCINEDNKVYTIHL